MDKALERKKEDEPETFHDHMNRNTCDFVHASQTDRQMETSSFCQVISFCMLPICDELKGTVISLTSPMTYLTNITASIAPKSHGCVYWP